MIATIEVNRLRLRAFHGVFVQERILGNDFEVTIRLKYPIDTAMLSDNLADTLNYARVVDLVKEQMQIPSQLLEHVVGRIKTALCAEFPLLKGGYICLAKLTPPIKGHIQSVSVSIEW